METTYTMIGSDGLQYGPINLTQIRTWVSEGRITPDTKVLRSDTNAWLPAAQYGELGLAQPVYAGSAPAIATAAPAVPRMGIATDPLLERRAKMGARWFFWIAGLSLVNTFISFSGKALVFVVGLAITQVVDQVSPQLGTHSIVTLVINSCIAGVFIIFGLFAMKRHSWSFIVGMVFYAFDTLLTIGNWMGFGFHILVLFFIFKGLQATMALNSQARGLAV